MRNSLALLALLALTATLYWPALGFDFVHYDDPGYVFANPQVREGLTVDGVRWALTTGHESNWHPMTWLSHMLDVQWFGLDAGAHHRTNLVLHLLNTALVVWILFAMTGAWWRAWFVGAVFALHPTHIESVAWVAERKDLLSTTFWLLSLESYRRFVRSRSSLAYLGVALWLALGLMSKPMLVTAPFLLLLLDRWPLDRLDASNWKQRSIEKLPLLALVVASSVVTYLVQREWGSVIDSSLSHRVSIAAVAYVRYLQMIAWPGDLAPLYPSHEGMYGPATVLGACLAILATTLLAWRLRRWRFVPVGWLWYLGTLFPVIGLVQVGRQSHADRYLYFPILGIAILVAWGVAKLVERRSRLQPVAVIALGLLLAGWAARVPAQLPVWRNSETLFAHALSVTRDNDVMHNNFGVLQQQRGNLTGAIVQYQRAIEIRPDFPDALRNLAGALMNAGRARDAIPPWERLVDLDPASLQHRLDLARALAAADRLEDAERVYRDALKLDADQARTWNALGRLLSRQGSADRAVEAFRSAVALDPGFGPGHYNLGLALSRTDDLDGAVHHLEQAIAHLPDTAAARGLLAQVRARKNRAQ